MINIVVVDDEPAFLDTLINKIADYFNSLEEKYSIDKYSNGYSILENYKKYHHIFLDIEMPLIDGITIAENFKAVDACYKKLEIYQVDCRKYIQYYDSLDAWLYERKMAVLSIKLCNTMVFRF